MCGKKHAAAKEGEILTIVLLSAYRVADYVLTDNMTLSRLVGTMATDIVKVGITTGASILAATVAGATTLAIGPILAVVIVGFGVSYLLEVVDQKYAITDRVVAGLDELSNNVQGYIEQKKKEIGEMVDEVVDSVIDYAVDTVRSIAIECVEGKLSQYLSPYPRM